MIFESLNTSANTEIIRGRQVHMTFRLREHYCKHYGTSGGHKVTWHLTSVNANANILYYEIPRGYQVDMTFDPTNTNANTMKRQEVTK
jgi:hypothetical protein